jgi:hypothetical protein
MNTRTTLRTATQIVEVAGACARAQHRATGRSRHERTGGGRVAGAKGKGGKVNGQWNSARGGDGAGYAEQRATGSTGESP